MTRRRLLVLVVGMAMVSAACGVGSGSDGGSANGGFEPAEGGEERTVLVDYRHDEFTSAFLRYYPEKVTVRPGDVVNFRQTWTGEPHSVTMGKVVDEAFVLAERFAKYDSEEAAVAGGETPESIATFLQSLSPLPGMTAYEGFEIYQPGAQPCFIAEVADVPNWSDAETEEIDVDAECPEGGREQPEFRGTEGLYNSGFIPPEGDGANRFQVPIATDAEPGTYTYFCNYHWTSMSGTVEIVGPDVDIPSQQEVNRQARKEIDADAELALARVEEARRIKPGGKVGDLSLPLAGRDAEDEFTVIINEFLPRKVEAKVGKPVTWTVDGIDHTISFNVPKYFPIFTVKDDGEVVWEPESNQPIGWSVPKREEPDGDGEGEPPPRVVDVGEWDGQGGFRSSGALSAGDTFTVTFTKAGSYPFACVLHPQMVGTVEVE